MNIKKYLLTGLLILNIMGAYAQKDTLFWNNEMMRIATPTSNAGWINIRPDILIDAITFFTDHKKTLQLGANDDMRLYKTETDKLGMTHYRYQQFYKGYKVMYNEFLLHARANRLISANGKMTKGLNENIALNISGQAALQRALQFLPATKYAWEISQLEDEYKKTLHNNSATYKPVAEIVWLPNDEQDNKITTAKYELAYMFDIYPASLEGKRIFVSATDGRILRSLPLSSNCDGTTATTNFNAGQGISTRLIPGGAPLRWNLWNDCQAAFIHTRQWVSDILSNEYVSESGNTWSGASSAATSHWATERAYNYFLQIYGRHGWDNNNAGVNVYQDALFCYTTGCVPNDPNNASMGFGNGILKVGNSGNSQIIDDWNSLDLIAHEFTHAVTGSTAALIYSKEPGALNESFSDILGVSCYAWFNGLTADKWKIGFDRKNPANTAQSLYLRNMANPNVKSNPDTYLSDPLWVNTTVTPDPGDNWGVHTNSGVQNYMYYLLVSGGSGVNKNGIAFSLVGVGIVAARDIAYRALTVYLTSTSGFADARRAWVMAAVDLYGPCSFVAIEAGKAWDAVGLAPPVINLSVPYCGLYGSSVVDITTAGYYSLAGSCSMVIAPASLVQFGANRVVIEPGFHAQNGSHFRAYISDCRYATY